MRKSLEAETLNIQHSPSVFAEVFSAAGRNTFHQSTRLGNVNMQKRRRDIKIEIGIFNKENIVLYECMHCTVEAHKQNYKTHIVKI